MEYWTLGEVRQKIEKEHDIQEEPDFLAEGEFTGYVNDVIDTLEQHFITIDDYFFATDTINLVEGQRDYPLPDDIYAMKIRGIYDKDNNKIREIKDQAQMKVLAASPGEIYRFKLVNNRGSKPFIRLFPTPTSSEVLDINYTRNASRVENDEDEIDIPEAMGYLFCYLRMRLYQKELNVPMAEEKKAELAKQEELLKAALATRTNDEENEIVPDVRIYADQYDGYYP